MKTLDEGIFGGVALQTLVRLTSTCESVSIQLPHGMRCYLRMVAKGHTRMSLKEYAKNGHTVR